MGKLNGARRTRRLAAGGLLAALAAGTLGVAADARASAPAPTLRNATSDATLGPARSLRITRPWRVTLGDVMLAGIAVRVNDRNKLTAPPGWRLVRSDRRGRRERLVHAVYLKVARAGEPDDYRWSFAAKARAAGGILAYRGVDARSPIDAHSGRAMRASRGRIQAPSVRTSVPAARIVGFFATRAAMRTAPPRGAIERFDAASRGRGGVSVAAAEFVSSEPGATGRMVAKVRPLRGARGARAVARIGEQVALRPAAGLELLTSVPPDVIGPLPDLLPPDTTITAGPSGTTTETAATFAFSATEPGSSFECRLDGGAWSACASPKAYAGLAVGSHTFAVRAVDAAGNADPLPATRSWTVRAVPGEGTAITSAPAARSNSTSATFAFTSTASGSTFACRLDGSAWSACTSPKAYTGLAQGEHTFEVRGTDSAGNTDPTPATWTWIVDTEAPSTAIDSGPSGTTSSTSASFAFSASESGSSFECRLDGGAWSACTSPRSYSGLGDGSHTFDVRATDAAGNTDGSPASRTWTIVSGPVDVTPPGTTIDSGPSGPSSSSSASFGFSSSEAGSSFECRLDGGAWSACTSPKAFSALADGSHTFNVRATDAAGNTDASPASRAWTVDTVAPDTSITSGPSGTSTSRSASFSFSSTQSGSTFACRLDGGSWGACTSPADYSGLADGTHTFDVRGTDPAGNTDSSPASRSWIVAGGTDPGPGEQLPPPLGPSNGATFHVATTGADANPGSSGQPWATVQKALNTLQPGQTAVVHAGTYTQALDLDRACTAAAPCSVVAAAGEPRPVLRVTNDHVLRVDEGGAYWRFRGFQFRDSNITSGGLVDLYGHHLELSNNELTNSGDQDFYLDEASHHIQLLGNHMHDSGLGRTHQSHGAYLQGNDHLVANNLIHDHPYGFGIQVYDKGLRSIVVNNTITHNAHSGIVVGGSGGVSGVIIRNNILAFNSQHGLAWDGTCPNSSAGTTYADHNVIFGNGSSQQIDSQSCSATSTAGGNRFNDPLFSDTSGRNFRLRLGSPAFDYALPEWAPGTDRAGNPRPRGSAPDAGAYEDG